MEKTSNSALDFTSRAWKRFEEVVDAPDFRSEDATVIYNGLLNNVKRVNFADYLKRYVYNKAQMVGNFEDVPFKEYRDTIVAQFQDNHTPSSFEIGLTRLSMAVKNWLTERTVSRKTVFLLGFGLRMTVEDVNTFLTKGICEQEINPKDPFEVICYYCYKNNLGYPVFERLVRDYDGLPPEIDFTSQDGTLKLKKDMLELQDEKDLTRYLSALKEISGVAKYSRTAQKQFKGLYAQTCEQIAKMYTQEAADEEPSSYTAEQITPSDVENVIYAGVPKSPVNGNLSPESLSSLADYFHGKRLSRQRLGKILSKGENLVGTQVSRFDIITLNFFIFSQKFDEYDSTRSRLNAFLEDTNEKLENCFMHSMILQNPYENFILCCLLADDPLATYSEVWEKSYSEK